MHPSWGLSLDQTIELLKWRCKSIGYDEDVDEAGIRAGTPLACLRILRFVFCNFSEALAEHLDANGLDFDEDMPDGKMVEDIIRAWSFVSPQPLLGSVSADKMLAGGTWTHDRLLFTLQCIFVCTEKHAELVKKNLEALNDDSWWKDDIKPDSSLPRRSVDAGEHKDVFSWMKEVYLKQLDSINKPGGGDTGAVQQAAFVAAMLKDQEVGWSQDASLVDGMDATARTTSPLTQRGGSALDRTEILLNETGSSSPQFRASNAELFRDSLLDTPFIT